RHAWEAEKVRLRASGVSLDPALLTPPPIPADQNFLAADTLLPWQAEKPAPDADRRIKAFQRDTSSFRYLSFNKAGEDFSPSLHSIAQALKTEGKIEAASDQAAIGEAFRLLAPIEPEIQAMRRLARERAQAQVVYPIETNWGSIFSLSQALSAQAVFELAEGRRQDAMDDARILLRLIGAADSGPTPLSNLVGLAMEGECLGVFSAGEKLGGWSDDDLREFGAFFARRDEFTSLQRSLRTVMAAMFSYRMEQQLGIPRQGWARFTPTGWTYQLGLGVAQMYQDTVSDFDLDHRRFDLSRARAQIEVAMKTPRPSRGMQTQKIAINAMKDAWVGDVGSMAVALELYHRAHGAYPARLEALVPQYLPRVPLSVLTGKPPAYAAVDRDHFHLASADWRPGAKLPEWVWYQ
ncbi:MAG TPA: hypothetical protein VHV47_01470, partial [Opitutaceae bacterium]|nr:hypothetical protein [Opitutaceae bacterium]